MKLYDMLEMLGESAKKRKLPEGVVQINKSLQAEYDNYAQNGNSLIPQIPIDVTKLIDKRMVSKHGESNASPYKTTIRQALSMKGPMNGIKSLTGWDGGLMAHQVAEFMVRASNGWLDDIQNNGVDPFAPYPWENIVNYGSKFLQDDPNGRFAQRREAGQGDKAPTDRGLTSLNEVGPTLAEFFMYLFVMKFQKEYGLDMNKTTKEAYVKKVEAKSKSLAISYINSLDSENEKALDNAVSGHIQGGREDAHFQEAPPAI
jgi:hypothetical protein